MKSRDFKVLEEIEDIPYKFNSVSFKQEVKNYIHSKKESGVKVTIGQIQEELAEEINVSSDAIKNWLYGYNGPAELEIVKNIAKCMEIDYRKLLERKREEKVKIETSNIHNNYETKNTTREIIRDIYQEMENFVREFRNEMGLFFLEEEEEVEHFEELYDNILDNIHRNMLDIPEKVYTQLEDYVEGTFNEWLHGIPCGIWVTDEYEEFLGEKEESRMVMQEYVNYVTKQFYTNIRVILKDYIVE